MGKKSASQSTLIQDLGLKEFDFLDLEVCATIKSSLLGVGLELGKY